MDTPPTTSLMACDQLPPLTDNGRDLLGTDLAVPSNLNPCYFVPVRDTSRVITPGCFSSVPFASLPLYIPGITTPVLGFDGGINKAALEVHLEKGLMCSLLPYQGMSAQEFIELFAGDLAVPVAIYTVTADDVASQRIIPLYIPRTRLPDGPITPIFMRLTRVDGSHDETRRFSFKVDTVAPAGINPIASTLQNENLHIPGFAPDIIEFGVDQAAAGQGVPVTVQFYPVDDGQPATTFRAPRDRIRMSIGGYIKEYKVTEGEAEGRDPVTIIFYAGDWAEIGSGSRVCEYQVIDEVGNASAGWSPAQVLQVRLDSGAEPLLDEPTIDEAPEDTLDYDTLDTSNATIRVPIRNKGYAIGDIIRIRVNGRAVDGTAIVTTYSSAPLTSVTQSFLLLPFPNADVKALVGGRLQLSYTRERAGSADRHSHSIMVNVVGTPIETGLARPLILEAVGGVLDPQLLFVNVEILPYPGQHPFDLVTLILSGEYANGNSYYREIDDAAGSENDSILFLLNNGPNADIAKLEGGTLRVYYRVSSFDGSEVRTSLVEEVRVGEAVASLPEPLVVQAPPPDYLFDIDAWTGNANIRVRPHADILAGDTIFLYCEGSAPGGTAPVQSFPVSQVWQGKELPFVLARQYILPNQTMRIYYTRVRDNVMTRMSHAVIMKVGAALDLPVPWILESTVIDASTATLNPLHVQNPPVFTIRVQYAPMLASDDIKVFFIGKPGLGSPDIAAKPGNPALGYVDFLASNTAIAANLDGDCEVYYQVTRANGQTDSVKLTLKVQMLPAQELDLVSIPEASGATVDVSKVNNVQITQWPFMSVGQSVWIELTGTTSLALRVAVQVNADEFSARRTLDLIPASYLSQLANGTQLQVKAWVSLDGSMDKATALQLQTATYTVYKRAKLDKVWTFSSNHLDGWQTQGTYAGTGEVTVSGGVVQFWTLVGTGDYYASKALEVVVETEPGVTYDVGFSVRAHNTAGAYGSRVYMYWIEYFWNPAIPITNIVDTQRQVVWRQGSGSFTAIARATSIGLGNLVSSGNGNDFEIDNVWIKER